MTPLETRQQRYYRLSSALAQIDNKQLHALLGDNTPQRGWGATHTITVDKQKVFVKRVPLTALEYDNQFSTANLYGMPTFYNYGVGSAGFGAFRELVTHVKTTNWVLDGSLPNFPLMYHYRIVPFAGERPELDAERHAGYVRYWNSEPGVDRYIRDRAAAPYEVILCLEHFPDVLDVWLVKNLDKSETIVREMRRTTAFLRDHGVIHFDAHFANIVVGDSVPYLTDYGLVLDKSFALDSTEKAFFQRHIDYDDGEFLMCLGSYLNALYRNLTPVAKARLARRHGIAENLGYGQLVPRLLENLETIHSNHGMKLDDLYVAEVVANRGVIQAMQAFFGALQGNPRKDSPYPQAKIKRLLQESKKAL